MKIKLRRSPTTTTITSEAAEGRQKKWRLGCAALCPVSEGVDQCNRSDDEDDAEYVVEVEVVAEAEAVAGVEVEVEVE